MTPPRRNALADVSLAPYIDPQTATAMPAPTFSQFTSQPPPEESNDAGQLGASAFNFGNQFRNRQQTKKPVIYDSPIPRNSVGGDVV